MRGGALAFSRILEGIQKGVGVGAATAAAALVSRDFSKIECFLLLSLPENDGFYQARRLVKYKIEDRSIDLPIDLYLFRVYSCASRLFNRFLSKTRALRDELRIKVKNVRRKECESFLNTQVETFSTRISWKWL